MKRRTWFSFANSLPSSTNSSFIGKRYICIGFRPCDHFGTRIHGLLARSKKLL